MGLEMKLQFKLQQQLVMTPQLQLAIKMLQLSRMELVDEVRKELDANPVLGDDHTDPQLRAEADRSMPSVSATDICDSRLPLTLKPLVEVTKINLAAFSASETSRATPSELTR